jgi:hypothetical protein
VQRVLFPSKQRFLGRMNVLCANRERMDGKEQWEAVLLGVLDFFGVAVWDKLAQEPSPHMADSWQVQPITALTQQLVR